MFWLGKVSKVNRMRCVGVTAWTVGREKGGCDIVTARQWCGGTAGATRDLEKRGELKQLQSGLEEKDRKGLVFLEKESWSSEERRTVFWMEKGRSLS